MNALLLLRDCLAISDLHLDCGVTKAAWLEAYFKARSLGPPGQPKESEGLQKRMQFAHKQEWMETTEQPGEQHSCASLIHLARDSGFSMEHFCYDTQPGERHVAAPITLADTCVLYQRKSYG